MKVNSNPRYDSISIWFQYLPKNAVLYVPRKERFLYAGFQAINYARYMDYGDKNISHVISLNDDHVEFYLPSEFINDVPPEKYVLAPVDEPIALYDLLHSNKDDLIIISGRDESQNGLSSETKGSLADFGMNIEKLKYRGSYAAIINNGQIIAEEINNKGPAVINDDILREFGIEEVASAGLPFGNYSKIIIDGENMSPEERGLNIVIVSDNREIERYNIDTHDTEMLEPLLYKAVKKK